MTDTAPKHLVLSALGPDRSGIVAQVTDYLTSRGANVEDSRMVVLGGEFGMLVLISGPREALQRVTFDLQVLERTSGMSVLLRPTKSPEEHRRAEVIPCLVTAEALDHEGIVRAIASAIHGLGINIVALDTTAYEAPVTGSPLFRLEAQVDVPRTISVAQLRQKLSEVAEAENLDIDVRVITSVPSKRG